MYFLQAGQCSSAKAVLKMSDFAESKDRLESMLDITRLSGVHAGHNEIVMRVGVNEGCSFLKVQQMNTGNEATEYEQRRWP